MDDEYARYLLARGRDTTRATPTLTQPPSLVDEMIAMWNTLGWMADKMGFLEPEKTHVFDPEKERTRMAELRRTIEELKHG